MSSGFVKLYRAAVDNGWLTNPILWTFWTYCLLKATHKVMTAIVGNQQVRLLPGQFVFGRRKAKKEIGLSEQQIRTCVDVLKKMENITIKTTNKYSIITVINWDTYQGHNDKNNPQNNPHSTHTQPHTRSKELKNKENTIALTDKISFDRSTFKFVNLDGKLTIFQEKFPALDVPAEIRMMEAWLMSNPKNKKSNYERFITNWLSKAQDKAPRIPQREQSRIL